MIHFLDLDHINTVKLQINFLLINDKLINSTFDKLKEILC